MQSLGDQIKQLEADIERGKERLKA